MSDADLSEAGRKAATAMQIRGWQGNTPPRINKSGDLAGVDSEFIVGRDYFLYTSTFHKVGGVWTRRGIKETLQALPVFDSPQNQRSK